MTSLIEPRLAHAVRRAAVRATMAPSVHNTQPWRFVLSGHSLEIHADWSRRLRILDPSGRQLLVSCGCAVLNARASLAAAGYAAMVDRFPDPVQPNLLARFTLPSHRVDHVPLGELDAVVELRRTNRRCFADEPVSDDIVDVLVSAASEEGAELVSIDRPEHRLAAVRLSHRADELENADPAYRAELRAWTSDDPRRLDGVPATAVAYVDAGARDAMPIRDFDTRGMGWSPTETRSGTDQCLLLLGTLADTPAAWLRAGEALERVLLEITRRGYAASPLTQVIEVAATNAQLRQELQLRMHPHVLLRVGRAPTTPATRRRRLASMIEEAH